MSRRFLTNENIVLALEDTSDDENMRNHDNQEDSADEVDDGNDDSLESDEDHVSVNSDVGDVLEYSDEEPDQPIELSFSTERHPPSRDGTEWFCEPQLTGRTPAHNIIKGTVDKVVLPPGTLVEDPIDSFRLYITGKILMDIVKYTNIEALRVYRQKNYKKLWKPVDSIEIEAFLGLLLAAGHLKMGKVNTRRLWNYLYGSTIFRATMGLDRFMELMRF